MSADIEIFEDDNIRFALSCSLYWGIRGIISSDEDGYINMSKKHVTLEQINEMISKLNMIKKDFFNAD